MIRFATTTQVLEMSAITGSELNPEVAQQLDPDGRHLIVRSILHNDVEVRAEFWLKLNGKDQPVTATIDCPIRMYNQLGSVD